MFLFRPPTLPDIFSDTFPDEAVNAPMEERNKTGIAFRESIVCSCPGHRIGWGYRLLEIEVEGHRVLLRVSRSEAALSA